MSFANISDGVKAFRVVYLASRSAENISSENLSVPFGTSELHTDLYLPQGQGPFPGMVLCHGLTQKGHREPRVIQLAHAFRSVGFAVMVPNLPEAERLKIDPITIDQIVSCVSFLSKSPQIDENRCGIFGVSYTGTLSILAAEKLSRIFPLKWICSLGGYSSLEDLIHYSFTGCYPRGGPQFEVPPDGYGKSILQENFLKGQNVENPVEVILKMHPNLVQKLSISKGIHFSTSVRVLLFHSQNDCIVPWKELKKLRSRLVTAGVEVEGFPLSLAAHARVSFWKSGLQVLSAVKRVLAVGLSS